MNPTPENSFLKLINYGEFIEISERTEAVQYVYEHHVQEAKIVCHQIKTLKEELKELEKKRRSLAWAKPRLVYFLRKVTEIQSQIFSSLTKHSQIPDKVIETLETIIKTLESGH